MQAHGVQLTSPRSSHIGHGIRNVTCTWDSQSLILQFKQKTTSTLKVSP